MTGEAKKFVVVFSNVCTTRLYNRNRLGMLGDISFLRPRSFDLRR
jgi:hypothetical protein